MVVFGARDTRTCVEIPIEDDDVLEKTECFKVNYNIPEDTPGVMRSTDGPNELTVNIIENDGVLFVVLVVVCCLQCCLSTLLYLHIDSSFLVFTISPVIPVEQPPVYTSHFVEQPPVYTSHFVEQPPVYTSHFVEQPPVYSGHCIK